MDQMALDMLFEQLDFHVVVKKNNTAEEMRAAIEAMAKEDHSAYDCFACAVLTHGKEGSLYGVDGKSVTLKEFTDAVDGNNCPTLTDKPKLFFIQACQGTAVDEGAGKSESDNVEEVTRALEEMNITPQDVEKKDATGEGPPPTKADIFVAMATVEETVLFGQAKYQSDPYLVRSLLSVFYILDTINSAMNFYVYFATGSTFRKELRNLLCEMVHCSKKWPQ
nr:hypothetical protein BaRGS_005172 [Batillaria attramentaria]